MSRPQELTDEERTDLRERGYRPARVWLRRRDEVFWREVLEEAAEIGRAEDEADLDLFIEAAAQDTFRLIDEMDQQQPEGNQGSS